MGFLKWWYPQLSSISVGIFHEINHPASLGYPHFKKPPYVNRLRGVQFLVLHPDPYPPEIHNFLPCRATFCPSSTKH